MAIKRADLRRDELERQLAAARNAALEEAARAAETRYLHGEAGIAVRDAADVIRALKTAPTGERDPK
jgi:hypothetical protein